MPKRVSGQRYAQALFELALEQGQTAEWAADLELASQVLRDEEFRTKPAIRKTRRLFRDEVAPHGLLARVVAPHEEAACPGADTEGEQHQQEMCTRLGQDDIPTEWRPSRLNCFAAKE